jgi:hypothetical protein
VDYRLLDGDRRLRTGRTRSISASFVLLDADEFISENALIELGVAWPVRLTTEFQ